MTATRACSVCPWRLTNQGSKPDPHGFYTAANLKRLWDGLRTAEAPGMTCHPTDPRMIDFAGYEGNEGREMRECVGAITLVAREVFRFQAIVFEVEREATHVDGVVPRGWTALRIYRNRQPKGMNRDGLAEVVARFVFGGTPLAREIRVTPNLLNDPEVGYVKLGVWDPAILEAAQR